MSKRFLMNSLLLALVFSLVMALSSCGEKTANYEQITQDEAKQLMETESDYIIVDARSIDEYNQGHIKGAICIPYEEISTLARTKLEDKGQLILVYCRSGRRSKIASDTLAKLGYTKVKEFGGINTWKYEIEK